MSQSIQNYELAFHINPDVEEAKIQEIKQAIEANINQLSGSITYTKDPERMRLSYPINHQRAGYFGYIQFSSPSPDSLKQISEQMNVNPDIIRHILIKIQSESEKRESILKQIKTRERAERKAKAKKRSFGERK